MPGTATPVIRIKDSSSHLAMSVDGNGRFCELDPRTGARIAVAEAARNVICSGARPVAVTNCLNFGNPEKPEIMAAFSEVVDGIAEACAVFSTPVTGGNVSFYNETEGESIFPTPVIGMVGILKNKPPLTPFFKHEGDEILLVGKPCQEAAASRYATLVGPLCGPCPEIDLKLERRCCDALLQAFDEDLLQSLHDCSDGGLVATVAECCFGGYPLMCGCRLMWEGASRPDAFLFGESQTRYLLSCRPPSLARLRDILDFYRIPYSSLGRTGGKEFLFHWSGKSLIQLPIDQLHDIWYNSLANQMG